MNSTYFQDDLHSSAKNGETQKRKKVLITFPKYTHKVCMNFKICVPTFIQWTTISKTQFSVQGSNTPVTLKQGQSHPTVNDSVDPMEGCNHAIFQRPYLNSVRG